MIALAFTAMLVTGQIKLTPEFTPVFTPGAGYPNLPKVIPPLSFLYDVNPRTQAQIERNAARRAMIAERVAIQKKGLMPNAPRLAQKILSAPVLAPEPEIAGGNASRVNPDGLPPDGP